jgi:hypothetical protein
MKDVDPLANPKDNPNWEGEQIHVAGPISLPAQIAIAEMVLSLAPYLAAKGERERLVHLHLILFYLMAQNEHGPISFIDLSEYLGHIEDAFRENHDPVEDGWVKDMKADAEEMVLKAKAVYKEHARTDWKSPEI